MRDISEAFAFPFKDADWPMKFLIGAVFTFLSVFLIGVPVLYGYYIELVQRVRRGESYPLPEWKDVGVKFIVGFKYFIATLIYSLPILIIVIPLVVTTILTAVTFGDPDITGVFTGGMWFIAAILVILPYSLFIALMLPVITIRFAERERIIDAIDIGSVLRLFGKYWQDSIIAALLAFVVSLFSWIGIIALIVGILFTLFYGSLVRFHLYGQIAQTIESATPPPIQQPL